MSYIIILQGTILKPVVTFFSSHSGSDADTSKSLKNSSATDRDIVKLNHQQNTVSLFDSLTYNCNEPLMMCHRKQVINTSKNFC